MLGVQIKALLYGLVGRVLTAGNESRAIDHNSVCSAGFSSDNAVVVTGGTATGGLASGTNWRMKNGDFIVPSDNVGVLGFDAGKNG